MKILITGANGLMGQKLVANLLLKPTVDFLATSLNDSKIVSESPFAFSRLDVRDTSNIEAIVSNYKPNVIIHTAAMTDVGPCENNHDECWELNVSSTQNLIDACNKYNSHLIYTSTDFVFDGETGPYSETDQPNPVSFYGKSKFEAEKLVIQNSNNWAIVRTILVYGVYKNMARSNIVLWVKKNLEAGKRISVVNDQFRMPTFAEDLASGTIEIALRGATGIYHLSGKDYLSVYEIAMQTAHIFGLDETLIQPVTSTQLNETGKRPPRTGFILDKARCNLDYCPLSFEEGLNSIKEQLDNLD